MKVVECPNTQGDFVAWFKFKLSYEEKAIRFVVIGIIFCTLISLVANYTEHWLVFFCTLGVLALIIAGWCVYNKRRLEVEMAEFMREKEGRKAVVRFTKHGIKVEREGTSTYYTFDQVRKVREIPWYLFLFVEGENDPLIIDKTRIETVSDSLEPYYIATKLRTLSPNYKYVRESDLTYTGKYSKLVRNSL